MTLMTRHHLPTDLHLRTAIGASTFHRFTPYLLPHQKKKTRRRTEVSLLESSRPVGPAVPDAFSSPRLVPRCAGPTFHWALPTSPSPVIFCPRPSPIPGEPSLNPIYSS